MENIARETFPLFIPIASLARRQNGRDRETYKPSPLFIPDPRFAEADDGRAIQSQILPPCSSETPACGAECGRACHGSFTSAA